jgi:hypothetical protein
VTVTVTAIVTVVSDQLLRVSSTVLWLAPVVIPNKVTSCDLDRGTSCDLDHKSWHRGLVSMPVISNALFLILEQRRYRYIYVCLNIYIYIYRYRVHWNVWNRESWLWMRVRYDPVHASIYIRAYVYVHTYMHTWREHAMVLSIHALAWYIHAYYTCIRFELWFNTGQSYYYERTRGSCNRGLVSIQTNQGTFDVYMMVKGTIPVPGRLRWSNLSNEPILIIMDKLLQ